MDITYLRARHQASLASAARAGNEPARRAHAELATLYADRIAAAEREGAPTPTPRAA